jgi:hypothetical protein
MDAAKSLPSYGTLYDEYAMAALAGLLAGYAANGSFRPFPQDAAKVAFDFAEAMRAERARRLEGASGNE